MSNGEKSTRENANLQLHLQNPERMRSLSALNTR
jgi:hypothetical protein